jgi:hypothetical protein
MGIELNNYLQTIFLFLILFFRSYDDNHSITDLLKSKFQNAVELYCDMTVLQNKRPNCEQILMKKDLWALNEEEFGINDELKKIINSKESENDSTIYSMLRSKFKRVHNCVIS